MDPAENLNFALYFGRHDEVERILREDPDLARANFGLMCALYDIDGIEKALEKDQNLAKTPVGPRSPILHLSFSRHLHGAGDETQMVAVARTLIQAGADPNDGYIAEPDSENKLSALYGAIGHADNPVLGRLLLEAGADPNDNESLYHSTEQSHSHSLRLLLEFGAKPEGTNALLRALDFDNAEMVAMLLAGGADPNEGVASHVSGEPPMVISALHQAARRMCSGEVVEMLIAAGADVEAREQGVSPYALARIHKNDATTQALVDAGASQSLSDAETFLVAAAEGSSLPDDHVDEQDLPMEYRRLLCRLASREGSLDHMRRLVALGLDPDVTDEMKLPPVHLAGWEGLYDHMAYFLTFAPDLEAVNGFGGTLLSSIVHGFENAPKKDQRDHARCIHKAIEEGAIVPDWMTEGNVPDEVAKILSGEHVNDVEILLPE